MVAVDKSTLASEIHTSLAKAVLLLGTGVYGRAAAGLRVSVMGPVLYLAKAETSAYNTWHWHFRSIELNITTTKPNCPCMSLNIAPGLST